MSTHMLMPDTQAILLLCASFGQHRQTAPQPLTLGEYNDLTSWLKENHLRPADLLTSSGKDRLQEIAGVKLNSQRLIALLERGVMLGLAVESWTSKGIWILGRSDAEYPQYFKARLRHLAPAILYGVGSIELLALGGLAVVGSRNVDEEGIDYTQKVVQTCAEQSIQIISGGARGVDRAAMLGVLEVGGTAVGVLADSLTKAAVAGNYRPSIREGRLTLVSTYDPDAGFSVGNAMGRNKYIYALADYALVVSSSLGKGGTWAGAVEALEQIKHVPVFVRVQGSIPEGNRQLASKGAKPFPEKPWNGSLKPLLIATHANSVGTDALNIEPITPHNAVLPINAEKPLQVELHSDVEMTVAKPSHKPSPILHEVSQSCPNDVYEAVIPLILENLEQPKDAKTLAGCLNVRLGQMQDWLKRAVTESKVRKTKNCYVANQEVSLLSLLPQAE